MGQDSGRQGGEGNGKAGNGKAGHGGNAKGGNVNDAHAKGGWNAGWGNAGKIRGRNGGFPSGGRRGGVPFKATGHKGGISRQG